MASPKLTLPYPMLLPNIVYPTLSQLSILYLNLAYFTLPNPTLSSLFYFNLLYPTLSYPTLGAWLILRLPYSILP